MTIQNELKQLHQICTKENFGVDRHKKIIEKFSKIILEDIKPPDLDPNDQIPLPDLSQYDLSDDRQATLAINLFHKSEFYEGLQRNWLVMPIRRGVGYDIWEFSLSLNFTGYGRIFASPIPPENASTKEWLLTKVLSQRDSRSGDWNYLYPVYRELEISFRDPVNSKMTLYIDALWPDQMRGRSELGIPLCFYAI